MNIDSSFRTVQVVKFCFTIDNLIMSNFVLEINYFCDVNDAANKRIAAIPHKLMNKTLRLKYEKQIMTDEGRGPSTAIT
jgi:hypothetical protein